MPVDFRDAAERHWEDAGHLLEDARLANADHLFGLSAECALKAVMLGLGMKLKKDGKPEKPYTVHINLLWDEFITFASDRSGAHYATRMTGISNPFDDWDVNQRYDNRASITVKVVVSHQQAAETTKQVLETAVFNGDII
jgi:hypothetical protein